MDKYSRQMLRNLPSGLPLVLICISAHNSVAYIGAGVQSVFDQTHADIEPIIIDANSHDDTTKMIDIFHVLRIKLPEYKRNFSPA